MSRKHFTITGTDVTGQRTRIEIDRRTGSRPWWRWMWEARAGGWGIDGGFALTRRGAISKAERALEDVA